MNKVKIISNPYEKKVLFERWNNQLNSWVTIDQESNSNSKLISNDFQTGFFRLKYMKLFIRSSMSTQYLKIPCSLVFRVVMMNFKNWRIYY